jgi:diadenylate cyclase
VNAFESFRLLHPGWRDIVEIAVVSFALYRILLLFHGTRAIQLVAGIVVLLVAYAAAWLLKLGMVTYILGLLFPYGAIALVVVFQPELRAALAHLGQTPISRLLPRMEAGQVAEEVADAVDRLGRSGMGAIIAIEREVPLGDYVASGSAMEAKVSTDLLTTIFTPYTPLHDGAVIVRGDMIIGAGCILPLSQAPMPDRSLGTRHRAALGLTEETDAVVVVVSEETSTVSAARDGRLFRNVSPSQLRDLLAGREPRQTGEQRVVGLEGVTETRAR